MTIPLRFFVRLQAYGIVDGNDKIVYEVGHVTKRIVAEPDEPLALVVAILEQLQPSWRYSTTEAALQDLQRLKDFVDGIQIQESDDGMS